MRILFILMIFFGVTAVAEIPSMAIRTTDKNLICTTRTPTIRDVPESVKMSAYVRQGIQGNHQGLCDGFRGCEVDHRVSLEAGGSNDLSNLIVAPYFGACNMAMKDVLENKIHRLICSDQLSVTQGQEYLYNDWETAYKLYINKNGCK